MKAGWEVKPLGEVCRLELGSTPQRKNPQFWDEERETDNVWLSIADMSAVAGKTISDSKEYVSEVAAAKMKTVPKGTLLLSFKLSLGRVAIAGRDLRTNEAIVAIHDLDAMHIDREYLYWYFTFFDWDGAAANDEKLKGKTLNKAKLKVQPVLIPPLEEQKQIVAALDAAFEGLTRAKENAEANLQNARELFGAFLEELFFKHGEKWPSAPLQDTVTKECTLSYGIVQPGENVEGGLPVVRPTDLGKPLIAKAGLKTIASEKADGYARTQLVGDEILLCVRGTTGVVARALPELKGGNVTRGIVPIRFDPEKMVQDFGYYQFRSRHIQEQIEAQTYGAALRQINIRDLRKLSFVFPDILDQKKLLPMLQDAQRNCEALIEVNLAKLTDIEDLRQSLLQKAFAGELT